MNIHEYQAKELFDRFQVPSPQGKVASTPEEAAAAAKEFAGAKLVIKAQVHAGGRGKGHFKNGFQGGVHLIESPEQAAEFAGKMLNETLVTVQTGEAGKQVNRLYVTDGVDIASEYYLSMLVDRATGRVAMIVSTEGGMDIEQVAHDTPEKITTITIDPAQGFMPHHGRAVAFALKLTGELNKQAQKLAKQLYTAFMDLDCSMLEINPLVETEDGNLLVLDTKMSFDSNALYRHADVQALRDETEEDPAEVEASEYDLAYIKLDGTIGCMVNGAGLAMATMDIIKLNGAFPANFLDVGGGANREKVTAAFKIILKDPAVEGILVNIFGGIMKCDVIADGIVAAAKDVNLSVPLVVRLEGTNVEKGKEILNNSGLPIVSADDLGDAARKIVAEVKKAA